jgi:hypothetical protein
MGRVKELLDEYPELDQDEEMDYGDLEVYANDCVQISDMIEARIASAVFDGTEPMKGTWEEITLRLDKAAHDLWMILHDIAGDR